MEKRFPEKDPGAGRAKRLKNLIPAKPGNDGYGGGRPKGSISLPKLQKKYLATIDPASGKKLANLLVENATKRAINKGGPDLKFVLEMLDIASGNEKANPLPTLNLKETLMGLSDAEKKLLAEIELKRRNRGGPNGSSHF